MPETLFGNAVPETRASEPGGLTVGTRIRCTTHGQITAVRWYVPTPLPTVDIQWALYRYDPATDGSLGVAASGTVAASSLVAGWLTIPLSTPVIARAGDEWVPAVWTNEYPATVGYFAGADRVSGSLVGPADDSLAPVARNGRFASSPSIVFPTDGFSGNAYFVDIQFVPVGPVVAQAGFEWGTAAGLTTGNSGNRIFDSATGSFTVTPAAARSGDYGLRVGLSTSWVAWTTTTIGSGLTVVVGSLYFRFPTVLPGVDAVFLSLDTAASTNAAYLKFNATNSRIYAGTGGTERASSVVVTADTWYRLDFRWDISTSTYLFEWQIDGNPQSQATGPGAASTFSRIRFGCPTSAAALAFVDFDDVLISATPGVYPLGEHKVELLTVDAPAVREFDGVDDRIITAVGQVPPATGPVTVLALWKPLGLDRGCLIRAVDTDTDSTVIGMNPYDDGNVYVSAGNFTSMPYTGSEGWLITGAGKAGGNDPAPVGHWYDFDTGTWSHPTLSQLNGTSAVPDEIRFGWNASSEFGAMRLALVGVWDSKLDNATVEQLASSLQAWVDSSPVVLLPFTQPSADVPVQDLTGGGADQMSIVGTVAVRDDVPAGFDLGTGSPLTVDGDTANFNTFTANGTLAAWDAATARAAISDVAPKVGPTADGIAQVAAAPGDYVQVPMSSYTLQDGESVLGVRVLACGWAANGTASTIGFRLWNGSAEWVLAAVADHNFDADTANPSWVCRQVPLEAVAGQTELDTLAVRIGYSDNTAVPVGVHAVLAEAAIRQLSGVGATASPAAVGAAAGVPAVARSAGATVTPAPVVAAAAGPVPGRSASSTVVPQPVGAAAGVAAPHAGQPVPQPRTAAHTVTARFALGHVRRTA
ncbi:MAG TPA: DUF4082 domain-containing protein [Micromonosporaceae bacterium]